jgi:hypothetical protein
LILILLNPLTSLLGIRSQFHVYFIPHRSVACEQMLEDEGVLDMVTIGEYRLGFVPLNTDILSLEMIDLYQEVTLDSLVAPHAPVSVLPQRRFFLSQYRGSFFTKIAILIWEYS